MFKRLTFLVIVLAVGWSAYWAFGAWSLGREYQKWFEARAAEGWQAEYSDVALRGFPNRFDTTWENITLVDPETGLGWDAPFFQLFMLSYQPNHLIATWPESHTLLTPEGRFVIDNNSLQASLITDAATNLPLRRANLAAETLSITDPGGATTALAAVGAAIERQDEANAYRVALNAQGLALSAPFLSRLPGDLPEAFKTARIDMVATFDAPWDLRAIDTARPQPTRIELAVAEAEWGPMRLRMAGDLDVDSFGTPTGRISVQARNWPAMLDVAVQSGALPQSLAQSLRDGLSLLAGLSGNPETLDLDLELARGQVLLGPLPLGPAPKLALR
ncbi:DUF2125 domain-containing protein [Roseobacteraceae bacterium S113]